MRRTLLFLLLVTPAVLAQPAALEQMKAGMARNKQALAHYTWREEQTLSLDGEVKKTTISQVQLDAQGQPQKTTISEQSAAPKSARGPLRRRRREHKVEELQSYVKDVAGLARAYTQPDPAKLQQAAQSGNLSLGKSGAAGLTEITVTSYLKPGDSMTIVYDTGKKRMQTVEIHSYLDKPDNKVDVSASYDSLPDGTNHLSQATISGREKELTVALKNSDYTPRKGPGRNKVAISGGEAPE
jgi:hypothetical protein